MKLETQNTENLSNAQNHIIQMATMILASFILIAILAYLWTNPKKKTIKKYKKQYNPQRAQQQEMSERSQQQYKKPIPAQQNRIASKSFKFSMNQDYNQGNLKQYHDDSDFIDRQQEEIQLKSMLREDIFFRPQGYYSFDEARQRFLNNLKKSKEISLVYLDENDKRQRKERKQQIEEKKNKKLNIPKSKPIKQVQQPKNQPTSTTTHFPQQQKHQLPQTKPNKQQDKQLQDKKLFNQQPKQQQPSIKLNFDNLQPGTFKPSKPEQSLFTQEPKQPAPNQPNQGGLFGGLSFQLNPQIEKPISLFGQQPQSQAKKESPLFPPQNNTTVPAPPLVPKTSVLPPSQPSGTQLPSQNKQPASQPSSQQPASQPSTSVLPPVQKPVLSSQPSQSALPSSSTTSKTLSKAEYLQKLIDYGNRSKQHCELKKTKINNFGRSISNLKQIYDTASDFINTINLGDPKEIETLACQIFDFLLNKTIPVWPKQQGWEAFPPKSKNQTNWKISISTYVLKLNIYRVMGYDSLWLIVFGKLLSLLDFTWKRTEQIKPSGTAYKELDLVKNNCFSLLKQDDMAPKYFTRIDLITYFLFCMTTFDPQLVSQYLYQQAGQDRATYEEIKKYNYKWSYNYFWILVDSILQNKTKTYFKPVLYMNILSSMYLQIRKNKLNSTEFQDFEHLRKFILKEAIQSTDKKVLAQNSQIQALADLQVENKDFKFEGEDFMGQLDTFNFYFKEKNEEYKKASDKTVGFEQFVKRCSVFNYFKSDAK